MREEVAGRSSRRARLALSAIVASLLAASAASPAAAVTISGSITSVDSTHASFLAASVGTSCVSAQPVPSLGVGGDAHYDLHTLVNGSSSASCVTATYTASGNVFVAAYSPSFDPVSLTPHFLGSSARDFFVCGGTSGSFSFNVPASASFILEIEECVAGAAATAPITYSLDVTGTDVALAARLRSLTATATAGGALVRWRTASELDLLGFNVYREVHGRRVRLNTRLIAAHGAGAYSFRDRKAPRARAARYWIQAVNLDGSRSWYGPARLGRIPS